MAQKTVAQLLAEVNTQTNAVAARIQTLIDAAANNPELAAALAGLQAEADRLTSLASGTESDPLNP